MGLSLFTKCQNHVWIYVLSNRKDPRNQKLVIVTGNVPAIMHEATKIEIHAVVMEIENQQTAVLDRKITPIGELKVAIVDVNTTESRDFLTAN